MATSEAREKILSVKDLYTLPQTMVEVLRVADQPQTSAHDLSRIILRDAPITARLLKIANSAMYGRSGQVTTVHQAVVLLGFRSVKSVILSTAVYDVFGDQSDDAPIDFSRFWLHSLECASTAQLYAAKIGSQPQEEAFVGGLLHDIGLLVMAKAFEEDYTEFLSGDLSGTEWPDCERERFGVDHAEAGALLLDQWSFPRNLVNCVAHHHDALIDVTNTFDTLELLVALADKVAHHGVEPTPSISIAQIAQKHRVLKSVGLSPIDLSTTDAWVQDNLTAVAAHLDIAIGSPIEIMARANQRLYELYLEMEALVLQGSHTQKDELACEMLDAICGTLSHHINNASTTIMGHSELVELSVTKGKLIDPEGVLGNSMKSIQDSVSVISAVLAELKSLTYYEVIPYHDRAKILDIGEQVKHRLKHQRL